MRNLARCLALISGLAIPAAATAADLDYERKLDLQISGSIDAWLGYTFVHAISDLDDSDYLSSGVRGKLSLPLSDILSIQMDGDFEYTSNIFSGGELEDRFFHSWQSGVHLSARDPDLGLIGVFGGFGTGDAADNGGRPPATNHGYIVGGEAQIYWNQITLYVQGGYFDGEAVNQIPSPGTDAVHDAVFGRGVLRWFMTDDSRLQLEASYASGVQDSQQDDAEIHEWWVRYDRIIEGLPMVGDTAVYVAYRGARFWAEEGPAEYFENTFMVGTEYTFGGTSRREFDLVGATLDMPGFMRWIASGQPLD